MVYCQNCGTAVDGQFCPNCGTPSAGPTPVSGPTVTGPASSGITENIAGALCYVPLLGPVIFLLVEPYNRSKTVRFHAFQSLFLLGVFFVLSLATPIIFSVSYTLGDVLYRIFRLASWVIWIFMMYKAYKSEKIVLPVIGPLAEKQA